METQHKTKPFLIKKNLGGSAPQFGEEFPSLSDEDIIRQVQKAMKGQAFNNSVQAKLIKIENSPKTTK